MHMKKFKPQDGYSTFYFIDEWLYVHKAVYELHYGPIPKGYFILHKNGKKNDNRIENLDLAIILI